MTLKLSQTNFLLCKSQVVPLIQSLGVQNHLEAEGDGEPPKVIKSEDKEIPNPTYSTSLNNDSLLTTWLLGTSTEDILLDLDDTTTAFRVW